MKALRRRFVEQGLEAALERKRRAEPPVPRKLDGEQEARLVAICCSQPPQGRCRWNGTANVFLFNEPLRAWRQVNVTERRTKTD